MGMHFFFIEIYEVQRLLNELLMLKLNLLLYESCMFILLKVIIRCTGNIY